MRCQSASLLDTTSIESSGHIELKHHKIIRTKFIIYINGCGFVLGFFSFFGGHFFFLVCGLCACFLSSSRGVVGWCFCGGVVVFLWWCLCGDVFVVVWLGGVFVVVF